MRQEKTAKKKKDNTAVALLLAFCVMVAFSFFTVKSTLNKLSTDSSQLNINQPVSADIPVNTKIPTVDSSQNNPHDTSPEDNTKKAAPAKFTAPLSGEIITIFSKDMPIYSKTLNQYAVHNGIDIAATKDTPVKAISGGTVTKAYNDDKLGSTIEINHGDGYYSIYSNLSGTSMVEVSDVVEKGDVIGGVGNTSLFEVLDQCHLHLEIKKDGEYVDPAQLMIFQ